MFFNYIKSNDTCKTFSPWANLDERNLITKSLLQLTIFPQFLNTSN
jgi:hypothetical protein